MKPAKPAVKRGRISAAIALIVVALALSAIGSRPGKADSDDTEGVVHAPARVAVKNGVVVLTLTAVDQQNDGIMTTAPSPAPQPSAVIGYGDVLDPLGLIDLSNRYLDAASAVQTAEAKLAVSRAAFDRAKVLHRDQQNISAAQLEDAAGVFAVDKAALATAQSRLNAVSATVRQQWGPVFGTALIGQTALLTDLIERRQFIVKVTLPPGVAVKEPPASASARLDDGTVLQLAFISPATETDPALQGVSYFYEAPRTSGLLPGLHLEISLTAEGDQSGVIVPEAAVIWLQGKAWVYVRTGATTFERREISPERPAPNGGYIVTDVAPQAEIVVRGAQMLLSEEFRAQAPIED